MHKTHFLPSLGPTETKAKLPNKLYYLFWSYHYHLNDIRWSPTSYFLEDVAMVRSSMLWNWDEQNCSKGWGRGEKEKDTVAQAWDSSSSVPRTKHCLLLCPSDHGSGPCWARGLKKNIPVWKRKHLRYPDSQGIQELSVSMKRICFGTLSACQGFCKASQEKKEISKMTWKLLCCCVRELLPHVRVSLGKVMSWRRKIKRKGSDIISTSKMGTDI